MQIRTIVAIAVLTAIATTLLILPRLVKADLPVAAQVEVTRVTSLTSQQVIWLAKLMQCESGIKASAINPRDLDNTPSYGLLQFKPSTYAYYAKKYGVASTTDYMNPEGQVTIITQWILQGGINWHQQFPDCVSKLGIPPQKNPA